LVVTVLAVAAAVAFQGGLQTAYAGLPFLGRQFFGLVVVQLDRHGAAPFAASIAATAAARRRSQDRISNRSVADISKT
jgi:hypothetical protein